MSTKVYAMTHKKFYPPTDPTYIPLHVGRAGKQDLGYMGDDTGENISDLNCYYGELTGVYWLWQNLDFDGNVGICHYRRFFINEKRQLLTQADYDRILLEYDIITSQAIQIEEPYREYYGRAHHIEDLELEGEVIRELFPDDYPVFEQVMNGKKHYFGNLMVTSKKLFDEYCEWLFTIFAELGGRIDVSTYDDYHKRIFGFLSEQLLLVWITSRGLKVFESRVGITEEKAETQELKLAIGQLISRRQVKEARELFYNVLKIRPDIQLEHSDLKGEIPLIELILYICACEEEQHLDGMLTFSQNLQELIVHVRKVRAIQGKREALSEEEQRYLKETKVTDIMLEVLTRNAGEE